MNRINQQILNRLRGLLEKKVDLCSLTMFGSRARGDSTPDSDMDVVVVVKQLDLAIEKAISECSWQVGLEYGIVIVPISYSLEEWQNGPERSSLLALAVKSEGIPA